MISIWSIKLRCYHTHGIKLTDYACVSWENTHLHDSFIDNILAPRFPITHPIFPCGTSRTERVSSSGACLSAIRVSAVMKQV